MITILVEEKSVEAQILGQLQQLDGSQKQQVLDYIHGISHAAKPVGITGPEFKELIESLNFAPEDLQEIQAAIEEYEEVVDPDDIPSADNW